jgi:hypothetical protein
VNIARGARPWKWRPSPTVVEFTRAPTVNTWCLEVIVASQADDGGLRINRQGFGAAGLDMPALSIVPSAKNFDELVAFHCQWAEDEKWAKNALFVPGDPRVEIRPYNKAEQAGIKGRFVNLYDVSRITVEIQRTKTILDQHVGGKHIFAHGQYKHPASNRAPQGRDQLLLKLFTGRRKLQEHVSDTYRWAPPEAPVVTYSAGGLRTEASRYMSHPYVRAATVDDAEVARAQVHIVGAPPTSI